MSSRTFIGNDVRGIKVLFAAPATVSRGTLLSILLIAGTLAAASTATYAQESSDPWHASQVMKPEQLAKILSESGAKKPLLLQVGFSFFYRNGHIPGSIEVGPGMKPEGIQALKKFVHDVPRDRQVVLYCGCCPWKECPNIRPAFRTMEELGFKNVSVLYLEDNFQKDWVQKKFPTEEGNASHSR
jgi:thiosulfate/3-mercaptopyruvate sulfurtransferase